MKLIAFVLSCVIVTCFSCNNSTATRSALSYKNLESHFISIAADSAYTLKTPKGAIIKIKKHTFKLQDNARINLEIKEAYTMQDILLAGLSTESNSKPLKTAGMIFINASSNGENLILLKPIKISIPSVTYDSNMQLFKGEEKADSTINWIDPQSLDTSPVAKKILWGEVLYKSNCSNCHKVFEGFTGPPMAGTVQRTPNRNWLYQFITDPAGTDDEYAHALKNKWKPTIMTSFPNLGKEGIDAIYDYIDNEVALTPARNEAEIQQIPATDSTTTVSTIIKNPCGMDTIYNKKDTGGITVLQNGPLPENIAPDTLNIQNNIPAKPEDLESLRQGFNDLNETTGMYNFEIKTLGWYNIDNYVEGYSGTTYVQLTARLQMDFQSDMHVYLFCPSRKMLSVAYDHDGNDYSFKKIDGKVPLYLNDNAVILAFGSHADKMYYGVGSFNVKASQSIDIKIKQATEQELVSFIKDNQIDGIKIDITKKDNYNIVPVPCNGIKDSTVLNDKIGQLK